MRESGILLPIANLPSRYGIGCFSKKAYKFVDSLKATGQKYWQILPFGPTGYGDSPYQSFFAFVGNPYFIDFVKPTEKELLTGETCEQIDFGDDDEVIDYEKQYLRRFALLRLVFERWKETQGNSGYQEMQAKLETDPDTETMDYYFYMAAKNHFEAGSWVSQDEDVKPGKPEAVERYQGLLKDKILFYEFQQTKFQEQWAALKDYAHKQRIRIIGGVPIYMAFDNTDNQAHPKLFQFDGNCWPVTVTGCPPDEFSATGQLWENPLYRWDYHEEAGSIWWMKRVSYCFKLYDVVRVDRLRGFDEYYSIPYGEETAMHGKWEKRPGISIFWGMEEVFGNVDIIAEGLDFLTPSVMKLVKDTGFPDMRVPQLAFDSREKSNYLPCYYNQNCVVYTGTYGNDTARGWYEKLDEEDKKLSVDYMDNASTPTEEVHWDFIRLAQSSVAELCVILLQDCLGLGSEARVSTSSILGGDWTWRMSRNQFTDEIIQKHRKMTELYGRA